MILIYFLIYLKDIIDFIPQIKEFKIYKSQDKPKIPMLLLKIAHYIMFTLYPFLMDEDYYSLT